MPVHDELLRRIQLGSVNVEAISHKTFLFAYRVIEELYGGGSDVLKEITFADDGVVLFDGVKPIGVVLISFMPVGLEFPLVMECCVLDEYKGTKWAIRALREMKRILKGSDYFIQYGGDEYLYRGKIDSIESIVKSKAIGQKNEYMLIRNS